MTVVMFPIRKHPLVLTHPGSGKFHVVNQFDFIYSRAFSICADFPCDERDKGPPVQMHSLREFEQVGTCAVTRAVLYHEVFQWRWVMCAVSWLVSAPG